ncbi:MAG: hypothetical protein MJ175_04275 [Clostridia bacterium]|nr:hypothetical protein [Clostridia bacterium]
MLITEEQKRRYTAFWNREKTDRACFYLSAWDGAPGFRAPENPTQQWCDIPYRMEHTLYENAHTRYFAEGFPTVFTNFGPGSLAACIGGSYKVSPYTIWFENQPLFIGDWENPPVPVLHKDSEMYRMIEDMTTAMLTHGDRFFTSISDIGGTFDIIAALRGTENLLYDMYDNPDEIKAFLAKLEIIWRDYYLDYANRLIREQGCMTSWMHIWSDKTYYPLQCDYSAMLSPEMFAEFILPDLRFQTEYMERSIYHLDGIGELPHVDHLLSLPRLCAIQWTSGDGKPPLTDPCWFELYHRIQAAGKGIVLLGADPAGLENLFRHVSQRGLYISCGVRDEKDAKALLDMAEKLNF